jgi:hypothetical protein
MPLNGNVKFLEGEIFSLLQYSHKNRHNTSNETRSFRKNFPNLIFLYVVFNKSTDQDLANQQIPKAYLCFRSICSLL